MISWMYSNFGHTGLHTTELPALEYPKIYLLSGEIFKIFYDLLAFM